MLCFPYYQLPVGGIFVLHSIQFNIINIIIISLLVRFRFGVIVAFATNSYMQYGIEEGNDAVRAGSTDTQKFLSVTSEQLDYVLVTNFKQLSDQLELILRGSG